MEFCMEARALKSSLRHELAAKATQQHVLFDDYRCVAGVFGAPATEDFSVDDLLDLSGGEFEVDVEEEKDLVSVSSREVTDEDENLNFGGLGSAAGDSDSFLSDELVVPEDDIAELEWLSQFVDDSISEPSLLCPVSSAGSENRTEPRLKPGSVNFPYFPLPVPVKARTKRQRPAGRVWSLGTNSFTDSASSTSSCSSGSTGVSTEPVLKKQRKKSAVEDVETGQFARRCSHCLVQKTPQWRTGPQGPKTLCNACGVRFKSGRLLPEYRPACSPTFSREVHSNSHRKVMEMRKRKDTVGPESGSVQMVASFLD